MKRRLKFGTAAVVLASVVILGLAFFTPAVKNLSDAALGLRDQAELEWQEAIALLDSFCYQSPAHVYGCIIYFNRGTDSRVEGTDS